VLRIFGQSQASGQVLNVSYDAAKQYFYVDVDATPASTQSDEPGRLKWIIEKN